MMLPTFGIGLLPMAHKYQRRATPDSKPAQGHGTILFLMRGDRKASASTCKPTVERNEFSEASPLPGFQLVCKGWQLQLSDDWIAEPLLLLLEQRSLFAFSEEVLQMRCVNVQRAPAQEAVSGLVAQQAGIHDQSACGRGCISKAVLLWLSVRRY